MKFKYNAVFKNLNNTCADPTDAPMHNCDENLRQKVN